MAWCFTRLVFFLCVSKEFVLDAIHRCYRIVNGLYGSDYKPQYYCPRTEIEVVTALEALLDDVEANPRIISMDVESMYCNAFGAKNLDAWHPEFKVWCLGISVDDYQAICIPFDPDPYLIEKFGLTSIQQCPKILEIVKNLAAKNCLHHSTFDALSLSRYGLRFADLDDSMLIQYAIDDTAGDLGVDDLAKFYTEEGDYKKQEYSGHIADKLEAVDWDKLTSYCCHDADIERRLYFILREKAQREEVWKAYTDVLKVSNMVGIQMTLNGVCIDRPYLERLMQIEVDKKKPLIEEFYKRNEVTRLFDYIQNVKTTNPKHPQIKKFNGVATLQDISWTKPWQMEILFYDVIKLPCLKKTEKGSRSTDGKDLEKVMHKRPAAKRVVEIVLGIKEIEKKLSTYLYPYIYPRTPEGLTEEEKAKRIETGSVDRYQYLKADGFVHPRFHFHVARSGRSTSSDPNFQNIVSDLNVKRMFISRKWGKRHGHLTIPDYDKHEVRMAAWQCQDPMMIKALEMDIHTVNQAIQAKIIKPTDIPTLTPTDMSWIKNSLYIGLLKTLEHPLPKDIYDYPYQEIMKILTADEDMKIIAHKWEEAYQKKRTTAKESTFGPLFGQQPPAYALGQGISLAEAEQVFAFDRQTYPLKHAYAEKIKEEARAQGFVQSVFGKKRRLDYKGARGNPGRIAHLDRQAVNTKLSQGPASDLTLLAMAKLMQTFKELDMPACGCGTIHDSLVVDNALDIQQEVNTICKTVMEEYPIELLGPNPVRFKAEIKFGPNWGELIKV